MGCSQIHFDVAVVDNYTVATEPQQITLLKTSAVHILNGDPCTTPVEICVNRVVKCQKDFNYGRLLCSAGERGDYGGRCI